MRVSRPSPHSLLSCVTVVVLAGVPASAQWTGHAFEHEITVTATGVEEPADEVPLAVTVISREEMDDAQVDTVADMLRRSPGVTVMRSGDEGSVASVFTRGTESDHTLVLFDGVRLNSPYFGGYDWSQLTTAGLERIEVARGPYSALWGADAIGGVVQLVPARAGDGLQLSLVGEGGEQGWRRLEGTVGWAGEHLDVYASGLDRQGEGELANSDFATRQALVDVGWSWGSGTRVAVLYQDVDGETGIPYATPGTPSPNRRQRSEQRLLAVPLSWRVSDGWRLRAHVGRVERDFTFRDPDDPFGFTSSDTAADTDQVRLASYHSAGGHELAWGGEWREDTVSDASSYGSNLERASSSVTGAFVQDVWRAGNAFQVIMGARWDQTDEWGSEVSPRVHAGWGIGGDVELHVGYGEAFRQPSVGELYFPFSGNPGLRPETSRSWEAGLAWSPRAGYGRWQASLYSTEVDNLIEYDFSTLAFANVSAATMQGAELGWETPLGKGLLSSLQVTWLHTEDEAGEALLRRPEWSGAWSLAGAVSSRLRGDLTVLWVGSRSDVDPVTFETITLGSHLTGNLALAWRVLSGGEITLRVVNLTDTSYQEVAGYPASGRRFVGGLRWRL